MDSKEALYLLEQNLKELNQTPLGRRAFLASLPLLLSTTGCATKSKHRYREGDNTGQSTSLSVEDEKRMTREYLGQMHKEYPPVQDRETQRYINNLGQNIVSANGLRGNPYTYNFTVVESQHVNAFALPAGTIFVTRPLISMAETEAELAGVVGHEIGHVKARHSAERIDQAKKAQGKSWLFGLGGAILGGAAGYGVGKALCKKRDKECLRRAAIYGAAAGGAGGLLIQKFAFMANSREDEMEADRIGFKTATRAGFHKQYVGAFYSKLLIMEQQRKNGQGLMAPVADALSTHPPSQERVQQMASMASSEGSYGSKISSKQFEAIKKRLS